MRAGKITAVFTAAAFALPMGANAAQEEKPYGAEDTSRRMYVVDGWFSDYSVKNNRVDYGNGLVPANSREYYNSAHVTYLD